MALTDLLQVLDSDAERELAEVRSAHDRKAEAILTAAAREARRDRERILAAAEAEATARTAQLLAEAELAAAQHLRVTVAEELDGVRQAVSARLQALPGTPEGTAATIALLEEALAVLPDRDGAQTVHVHPGDATAVSDRTETRRVVPDLDETGVVLEDGSRRVVNTASERLDNLWPDLRGPVAQDWSRAVPEPREPSTAEST